MSSPLPRRVPTFFIAGAPKAGTTSLRAWCRQHPAIWMSPIKEPSFFAPELAEITAEARAAFAADAPSLRAWLDGPRTDGRTHGLVLGWDDYRSLFRDAGAATVLGEASANYLPSHTAPAALRARVPDARVVMLLRHPVDRLFSQFASALGARTAHGRFEAWVDAQLRAEAARRPRLGPIWTGMYGAHLRRWRQAFPPSQLRVHFHEDLAERPRAVLSDLFAFLGVDDVPIDVSRRHNVTTLARWPAVVRALKPLAARLPPGVHRRLRGWTHAPAGAALRPSAAARARVLALYRDDLEVLQALVDRDLGPWLSGASGA